MVLFQTFSRDRSRHCSRRFSRKPSLAPFQAIFKESFLTVFVALFQEESFLVWFRRGVAMPRVVVLVLVLVVGGLSLIHI